MVITLPGNPWNFRGAQAAGVAPSGTAIADSGSGRAYLLNAVVTFDASGAGRWFLWQGTTATVMVGPFYPTTCDSWMLTFGPMGLPVTATSLDIGYVCSTTGNWTLNLNGYTV